MIRATTGGVLKSYRSDLMNSFISMNKARKTVLTQRNFNSYAEDPAAASMAFRLRKARMSAESQYAICDDTYRKYQTAWSSLDTISKLIDTKNGESMATLSGTTLELLDDPKGDARTQLSKVLDQLSQTIIQNMNQKYGENFIFAGADGHNVPFEIQDNKLYYRGVPVDAVAPEVFDADGTGTQVTLNAAGEVDSTGTGVLLAKNVATVSKAAYDKAVADNAADPTVPVPDVLCDPAVAPATQGTPHMFTDQNGNDYYILNQNCNQTMTQDEIDKATKDAEKLEFLANEKYFVDIGLGFQEDENGQLIESSGFNAALNGLTFLGYGVDEDGDPKNIYSIVQEITALADSVPEGGSFSNVWDDIDRLVGKLETAASDYKTEYTNMDAGTTKLKNSLSLLEDNQDNLRQQYAALEDVDMVESITSFIWAEYCYNAALKVGNNVLSQSLMDYLS